VIKDRKVNLERKVSKATKEIRANLERKENKVYRASKANRASRVFRASKANKEFLVFRESRVFREYKESRVYRAFKENPERKEIQVLTHYGTGRASIMLNHNIKKVTLLPIKVQHIVETVLAIA
jgi:hypothetical protein